MAGETATFRNRLNMTDLYLGQDHGAGEIMIPNSTTLLPHDRVISTMDPNVWASREFLSRKLGMTTRDNWARYGAETRIAEAAKSTSFFTRYGLDPSRSTQATEILREIRAINDDRDEDIVARCRRALTIGSLDGEQPLWIARPVGPESSPEKQYRVARLTGVISLGKRGKRRPWPVLESTAGKLGILREEHFTPFSRLLVQVA